MERIPLDPGERDLLRSPFDLRMDGRTVWITGASRGLGRTLAYAFAGAGAHLLLSARSVGPLEEIASQLREFGSDVEVAPGSVSDPGAVADAVESARRRWGRLDVVVNNAGISPSFERSEQVEPSTVREILETNLIGPFLSSQASMSLLGEDGGGSIVNVSSIHGSVAHARMVGYAMSKGGLEMLTKTLAVEWADRNIRVNSVAPAYLETEMTAEFLSHPRWGVELRSRTPQQRFGSAREIAAPILFLASPLASYVTGATFFVDGGWSAQ